MDYGYLEEERVLVAKNKDGEVIGVYLEKENQWITPKEQPL